MRHHEDSRLIVVTELINKIRTDNLQSIACAPSMKLTNMWVFADDATQVVPHVADDCFAFTRVQFWECTLDISPGPV